MAQVISGYFDGAMQSVEEIEAMETQGSADEEESELARDGDVSEPKDMPVFVECLTAAIRNVPGVFENVPAAAKVVLESNEVCQALLIDHGNLPAFGDRAAAVKDILASNDAFTMDNDIPAECNELPEDAAILVSYKNTPAGK